MSVMAETRLILQTERLFVYTWLDTDLEARCCLPSRFYQISIGNLGDYGIKDFG